MRVCVCVVQRELQSRGLGKGWHLRGKRTNQLTPPLRTETKRSKQTNKTAKPTQKNPKQTHKPHKTTNILKQTLLEFCFLTVHWYCSNTSTEQAVLWGFHRDCECGCYLQGIVLQIREAHWKQMWLGAALVEVLIKLTGTLVGQGSGQFCVSIFIEFYFAS